MDGKIVTPEREFGSHKSKYKAGIFLSLFLNDSPGKRRCNIIKECKSVLGRYCPKGYKARIDEWLAKLESKGYINKRKTNTMPKRIPKSRKLQQYSHPDTWNKNMPGYNHRGGRYETHYKINPQLSPGFIAKLKHDVAELFGFESWHDGLFIPGLSREKIILNVQNSYAHRMRLQEGLSQPKYKTEKQAAITNGYEETARAEQEVIKTLMNQPVSIPRQALEGLDRRTIKLLERFAVWSQNMMKGEQKSNQ